MKAESQTPTSTNIDDTCDVASGLRLLQHLKEPQNLLNYLILSAWLKFMEFGEYIPTITIGG